MRSKFLNGRMEDVKFIEKPVEEYRDKYHPHCGKTVTLVYIQDEEVGAIVYHNFWVGIDTTGGFPAFMWNPFLHEEKGEYDPSRRGLLADDLRVIADMMEGNSE